VRTLLSAEGVHRALDSTEGRVTKALLEEEVEEVCGAVVIVKGSVSVEQVEAVGGAVSTIYTDRRTTPTTNPTQSVSH
jgi:hypothetical protein